MDTQDKITGSMTETVANTEITLENHEHAKNDTLVSVADDKMFTTSQVVAKIFDKNHFDILKAIKNLGCSPKFLACNFTGVEYVDSKGEKRPAFNITRDGFAFLAMGFTGKKAAAWKEKFLEAFNSMEALLRQKELESLDDARRYEKMIHKIKNIACKSIEKHDQNENKLNRLRAVISYWAFVDEIPVAVAEQATAMSQGLYTLSDIHLDNVCYNALYNYAHTLGRTPTGQSGPKAKEESLAILRNILQGIKSFEYTPELHVFRTDIVQDYTYEDVENFCQKDVDKLIIGAWGFFSFYQGVIDHLSVLFDKINGITDSPTKG